MAREFAVEPAAEEVKEEPLPWQMPTVAIVGFRSTFQVSLGAMAETEVQPEPRAAEAPKAARRSRFCFAVGYWKLSKPTSNWAQAGPEATGEAADTAKTEKTERAAIRQRLSTAPGDSSRPPPARAGTGAVEVEAAEAVVVPGEMEAPLSGSRSQKAVRSPEPRCSPAGALARAEAEAWAGA